MLVDELVYRKATSARLVDIIAAYVTRADLFVKNRSQRRFIALLLIPALST